MNDVWSERAELYQQSEAHRQGEDLDLFVEWAEGRLVLDVATGGGHVARRLRDAGHEVITCDPAPGMQADVVCRAEELPFADGSFDVVTCRVAAHHFEDAAQAVREMARVSRDFVLVADNLHLDETVEKAERLRDPTHVRCYSEDEWRGFFERAGLSVDDIQRFDKRTELEPWLERTGCEGGEAERVRELLADHIEEGRVVLTRIAIRGRKS
jgi:SAM-dependent methyltransferase